MTGRKGRLFILSAPTGVGKTTVSTKVLAQMPPQLNLKRVITYTSRPQRPGENDGKDYHFITAKDFTDRKEQGFFLETNEYDGNWYGSPASILADLDQGISYLMVVDRSGALLITQKINQAVLIWLTVSDFNMAEQRLLSRSPSSPEKQEQRIMIARREWHAEQQSPFFTYHITNDDGKLDTTVEKICMIIRAELSKLS